MPFPSGTYVNLMRSLGNRIVDEFESFYAQLEGYLQVEHMDDGTHGWEWKDYMLSWYATTTQPFLADAAVTSRYAVVGKTCHFHIRIVFGQSSTYGSGAWTFTLPPVDSANPFTATVAGLLSSTWRVGTAVRRNQFPRELALFWNQDDSFWTATNPGTWVAGDTLIINGTYEVS